MAKRSKFNWPAIRAADKKIAEYQAKHWGLSNEEYEAMPQEEQDKDSKLFYECRTALFKAITGESDFDAFYDRFDAPGTAKGDKPIAWTSRFIPDLIDDQTWNGHHPSDPVEKRVPLRKRVLEIAKLYGLARQAEKEFVPGRVALQDTFVRNVAAQGYRVRAQGEGAC